MPLLIQSRCRVIYLPRGYDSKVNFYLPPANIRNIESVANLFSAPVTHAGISKGRSSKDNTVDILNLVDP